MIMDKCLQQQLTHRYFADPQRQQVVERGEKILLQGGYNDRLYLVLAGELEGYHQQGEAEAANVLYAGPGAFIGVHSFFSGTWVASSTVVAKTRTELAWIDRTISAVDEASLGPLSSQFMPVILDELSRRQRRTAQEAISKEAALKKLYSAEQMSMLGQLAAGLAHEMNNAVAVVSSKSGHLRQELEQMLYQNDESAQNFFSSGLHQGQKLSSAEVRQLGREYQKKYALAPHLAKTLARATGHNPVEKIWLQQPEKALHYWQLGRDIHDLQLALSHTAAIVKSVKQLGNTEVDSKERLDINETLQKAVALLPTELRRVEVRLRLSQLPSFTGSQTELVQVWVNLLKNACDALIDTPAPKIEIQTRYSKQRILVTITNNGPEIDEITRRKMFQPNFTTKKGGLFFGLGLGLSVVERIISTYAGGVAVKSDPQRTIFRIKLPVEGEYGET